MVDIVVGVVISIVVVAAVVVVEELMTTAMVVLVAVVADVAVVVVVVVVVVIIIDIVPDAAAPIEVNVIFNVSTDVVVGIFEEDVVRIVVELVCGCGGRENNKCRNRRGGGQRACLGDSR